MIKLKDGIKPVDVGLRSMEVKGQLVELRLWYGSKITVYCFENQDWQVEVFNGYTLNTLYFQRPKTMICELLKILLQGVDEGVNEPFELVV